MKHFGKWIAILALGTVAAFAFLRMNRDAEWEQWLEAQCKPIGARYQDGKTGYRCDDGKVYWQAR